MAEMSRFRYRRERADGSSNETTSATTFQKWLREAEEGDCFFVAWCRWVQATPGQIVKFGGGDLQAVTKVREVEVKDNAVSMDG